ncbi:MAG TPA: EF-hand domain-containing protein [Blastocatellia bacterium]|nr:EF-hand domain-containing protein [Blastocatellia bacterium]
MIRILCRLALASIAVAGCVAVVPAQEPPPMPPPGGMQTMRFQMPTFEEMDKNKDKKISKDEFPGPQQFFDRLDENKDGVLDEEEVNRSRSRMMMGGPGGGGMRLNENLTKFLDADADTKVSREEFAKLLQLFDVLDKDHDGQVNQEELGRFLQAVNEAQAQATGGVDVGSFFANNDKNKDGKITPDELTNEKMFKALDLNKDGSIPRDEAAQAMKQMADAAKKKQQQAQPQ